MTSVTGAGDGRHPPLSEPGAAAAGSSRARPSPEDLLLSFEGRIGRGAFVAGLAAVAVALAATALIFQLPAGTYCRMRFGPTLASVWLAALAVMALILAAMLTALCWKRTADMGWWRPIALLPALAGLAFPLLWRLEALGACGEMTGARAQAVVWTGIVFAGALSLQFMGSAPPRRDPAERKAAPTAVHSPDE